MNDFPRRWRSWGMLTIILFLMGIIGSIFVQSTQAASIQVNVAYDNSTTPDATPGVQNLNDCSLREAIQNANDNFATFNDCPAGSGADVITFTVATITLTGQISVISDIQLNGPVTISGGNVTNMFVAASSGNGILRLNQLTLKNGNSTSGGAIVMNGGAVVCTTSRFEDNVATFSGGAINGNGPLDLNGCFFERNTAANDGGAIYHNGADPANIIGTIFRDNTTGSGPGGSGGAIYNTGPMTITGSVFDGNIANVKTNTGIGGGAIFHAAATNDGMVITASAFGGNVVNGADGRGGAVFSNGSSPLSINYSHFGTTPIPLPAPFNTVTEANRVNGATGLGAAVFVNGETAIVGTSFLGNISANHGGAFSYGSLGDNIIIANSTFSNNSATNNGGAIYNPSDDSLLMLIHVTIANNSANNGGGIFNDGDGDNGGIINDEILLQNSIVYGNTAPTAANCGGGTVSSDGPGNVIPAGQCANAPGVNGSPALGNPELTFSAGSIVTYARPLNPTSAALGVGNATICTAFPILNMDQRGFPRPQGGGNCDAGAYESSHATGGSTATSSPTYTRTPTATATRTPTRTATLTPSRTPSRTPTFTPSRTPSRTPTPTRTPTLQPGLHVYILMEGRTAPPDFSQSVSLAVTIRRISDNVLVFSGNITTDTGGHFVRTGLAAGNYRVRVKNNLSLSSAVNVNYNGATQTMSMGTLKAGDANNDNIVNATDFSVLATTFGKSFLQQGYNSAADFNLDFIVNVTDFSLLANNFGVSGTN